jgi:hypothetical protein
MINLKDFMQDVGLTSNQLLDKKTYIGGSSAKDIADGNWFKLYQRMVHNEGEDLSGIFKVQLGHITEEFNLMWFANDMDFQVPESIDQIAIRNDTYNFIGCLPDAIMRTQDGQEIVIDAKHTAAKAPWWDEAKLAEYYFPQAQHNMIATGIHKFYLSVIFGNETPVAIEIKYDAEWCDKYIGLCKSFWGHIERKDPPIDPAKIEVPKIALDDMRELDMTTSNMSGEWSKYANTFYLNSKLAKTFEEAKKELKILVPDDVKKAYGDGIEITRNKKGAMTVRMVTEDDK